MSDGHSVSVTFKKLKPIDQEEPLSLEDINADDLADCRVWGVDPGVGQIFVAVDGSDPSVYDVEGAMASEPPQEIRRYSKEYFHNAGFHRTNQRIRDLKSQHGIDTLESTIPSPCTMDLSKLDLYTKAVLERAQLLKDFYAEHLPPLRFLNHKGRQKTDGELVNIFFTGGNKYGRQSDRELVDLTVPEGNVPMQSPQEEQVDMDAYEHDGPHKDVSTVYPTDINETTQGCGWIKVRLHADNPGVWSVHCHITAHMMIVLQEAADKIDEFKLYQ
ncbi:hypothetical protein DM01DRAFT_1376270 [Hesseltinella vesiculosa]|uniref:Plastocyanin-like domain-containing protein n=1 Tax=Hesseltinella vesiculosa TaxID=101127 RepID=A0A1X2GAN8_9FUNG|nr:hypothetical protein DM01DRAFT_1376270 [Hesseltinella vesiculosa]